MFMEERRQKDINLGNREVNVNISKNCKVLTGNSATSVHEDTELRQEYIAIKNSLQRIDRTLSDKFQRIERTLSDIKFDMNHLTEQYQVISNLNLNVDKRLIHYRSPTPDDDLNKLSFPLQTIEEIESLQEILTKKEGLKEHMFNKLAAIGGCSYEEMSKRMLIFVFTNEVASLYS
ncbi:PREDICTED: uncharacterized protein LOC105455038 [Wasmannia auropunctata]|uniref:uncharacterized protein LOC105455038 n=1 Tax=Wasmannia auropunctata TaxID=64793 RepID=UPI0005EFA429|nr:PREDICTED: uncharacterized protein LOC105455038 [Wasmannia auropunctata]